MNGYFPVKDKELFLKYAIPCARVLVARRTISQEYLDEMYDAVVSGKDLKDEYIDVFDTGRLMTTQIAKAMGKDSVDRDVIHKYFLEKHNAFLQKRIEIVHDIDVPMCEIHKVKIDKIRDSTGYVTMPSGEKREVKLSFVKDAKVGDTVSVHYDYACEKI